MKDKFFEQQKETLYKLYLAQKSINKTLSQKKYLQPLFFKLTPLYLKIKTQTQQDLKDLLTPNDLKSLKINLFIVHENGLNFHSLTQNLNNFNYLSKFHRIKIKNLLFNKPEDYNTEKSQKIEKDITIKETTFNFSQISQQNINPEPFSYLLSRSEKLTLEISKNDHLNLNLSTILEKISYQNLTKLALNISLLDIPIEFSQNLQKNFQNLKNVRNLDIQFYGLGAGFIDPESAAQFGICLQSLQKLEILSLNLITFEKNADYFFQNLKELNNLKQINFDCIRNEKNNPLLVHIFHLNQVESLSLNISISDQFPVILFIEQIRNFKNLSKLSLNLNFRHAPRLIKYFHYKEFLANLIQMKKLVNLDLHLHGFLKQSQILELISTHLIKMDQLESLSLNLLEAQDIYRKDVKALIKEFYLFQYLKVLNLKIEQKQLLKSKLLDFMDWKTRKALKLKQKFYKKTSMKYVNVTIIDTESHSK